MKFLSNLMPFTPLLAAATVAICSGTSLSGYVAPVFEAVESVIDGEGKENSDAEETKKIAKGNFDLEDGIYEGTGTGFAGQIKVAVEIKDKSIISIEIIDSGADDTAFVNRAKGVIDKIIASQSFDVDVVSGATYSSNGIISAVKNALTGEVDNNQTASVATGQGSTSISKVEEPSEYKDGTYYGSGTGFAGTTTVKVVVSGGKITSISIQSTNDDSSYVQSASAVISRIIAGQTTNVDTVSGATYSSVGIIQAVRNALSQAAVNGTGTADTEKNEVDEEVTIVEGLFPYVDGTYYGTGFGYNSDIKVAVVIQGKTIRSISIVEHGDDAAFMVRAEKILDKVVANQTEEVDVVSGATFSSEGILEAIKDALAEADKATNGGSTDVPEEDQTDKTENPDSDENQGGTTNEGIVYNNGEYTVTVACEPDDYLDFDAYNLSVTVVVENDKIVEIKNVTGDGDSSNDAYINRAVNGRGKIPGVVAQILEAGTADGEIDVVSSATCTSNSIIEACQRALEQAKIAEKEEVLEEEIPDEEQADNEAAEEEKTEDSEAIEEEILVEEVSSEDALAEASSTEEVTSEAVSANDSDVPAVPENLGIVDEALLPEYTGTEKKIVAGETE